MSTPTSASIASKLKEKRSKVSVSTDTEYVNKIIAQEKKPEVKSHSNVVSTKLTTPPKFMEDVVLEKSTPKPKSNVPSTPSTKEQKKESKQEYKPENVSYSSPRPDTAPQQKAPKSALKKQEPQYTPPQHQYEPPTFGRQFTPPQEFETMEMFIINHGDENPYTVTIEYADNFEYAYIRFCQHLFDRIKEGKAVVDKMTARDTNLEYVMHHITTPVFVLVMVIHELFLKAGQKFSIFYDMNICPESLGVVSEDIVQWSQTIHIAIMLLLGTLKEYGREATRIIKAIMTYSARRALIKMAKIWKVEMEGQRMSNLSFETFLKVYLSNIRKTFTQKVAAAPVQAPHTVDLLKQHREDKLVKMITNFGENIYLALPFYINESATIKEGRELIDSVMEFERTHPILSNEMRSKANTNTLIQPIVSSYLLVVYLCLGSIEHKLLPSAEIVDTWWTQMSENARKWLSANDSTIGSQLVTTCGTYIMFVHPTTKRFTTRSERTKTICPSNGNLIDYNRLRLEQDPIVVPSKMMESSASERSSSGDVEKE
jgi:hypothetical protein